MYLLAGVAKQCSKLVDRTKLDTSTTVMARGLDNSYMGIRRLRNAGCHRTKLFLIASLAGTGAKIKFNLNRQASNPKSAEEFRGCLPGVGPRRRSWCCDSDHLLNCQTQLEAMQRIAYADFPLDLLFRKRRHYGARLDVRATGGHVPCGHSDPELKELAHKYILLTRIKW